MHGSQLLKHMLPTFIGTSKVGYLVLLIGPLSLLIATENSELSGF